MSIAVTLRATLGFSASLSATLVPAEQARDWKRRWQQIERKIAELQGPLAGGISRESIDLASDELHSFYVACYHLKDYLNNEASTTNIPVQQVEAAITGTPALALLADLANLDKHSTLTRMRSGHKPKIGPASGTGVRGGWRLNVEIEHSGTKLDGLTVANEAVDAWKAQLTAWGLL